MQGLRRFLPAVMISLLSAAGAVFPYPAAAETRAGSRVVRGVVAEGACAIYGMSAEQSQLLALQKARSSAIEQAAGVRVASSTLVRDGMVAADLIRTYSRGYVIREKVEWLPLAQYQDAPDRPPIPEYRVRIVADVAIPERLGEPLGLSARLENKVYRKGEIAWIEITVEREARVAVFNITADDRVAMLFPHPLEKEMIAVPGKTLVLPPPGSRIRLEMQTLPGHETDAEAFFVVAVPSGERIDFSIPFRSGEFLPLSAFFERYAEIASLADEIILPYVVDANE